MDRRKLIELFGKLSIGALFVKSPYAHAINYLDTLKLSTTPNDRQKFMIESNVEFALAAECGIYGDTNECRLKFCSSPALKAKCNTYGD